MIEVNGLSKRFGERMALEEVTFSVEKGSLFGLIGMSGAGKSTLVRCLAGLEKADQGVVDVRGEIGMIFQHFNLFSARTALENVRFPLEVQTRKGDPEALLKRVGLREKRHLYPAQLSGGEKQRVAIARALVAGPQVLLCDEATSALDPKTTQDILKLLHELNEELGLTIVLITHEMDVVKQICTHMAVLEQGRIVEQGSVASIFSAPEHPITRQLVQTVHPSLPQKREGLFRLTFRGQAAEAPLISQMVRQFDVEANILLGGIDTLRDGRVGNLVIELLGNEWEAGRRFLQEKGVACEPL